MTAPFVSSSTLVFYANNMMGSAVFLFLMLSGLVLWHSSMHTSLTYPQFVWKRLSKVIIPFMIWTVFYKLYLDGVWNLQGWNGWQAETWAHIREAWVQGNGMYHLYFISILVPLYLVFPLLKKGMDRFPLRTLARSFVLWVVSFKLMGILSGTLGMWAYYQPGYWVFYFAVSIYLYQHLDRIQAYGTGKELLLALLWGMCFLIHSKTAFFDLHFPNTPVPIKHLYTVSSFLILYFLAKQLFTASKTLIKGFQFVSTHSFFIYFVHPFALILFYDFILRHPSFVFHNGIDVGLKFIVVFGGSTFLSYLISFIPFSAYLGAAQHRYSSKKKKEPKAMVN